MTRPLTLAAATVLIAVVPATAAVSTVGVYDEDQFATNAVDVEAADNNITLASYTALVADAFANNTGGVFQSNVVFEANSSMPLELTYGTSQANTLSVAVNAQVGTNDGNSANGTSISSGPNSDRPADGGDNGTIGVNSGSGVTFNPDQLLGSFAITALLRSGGRTVDFSVLLEDGTVVDYATENISTNGDTFFAYQADAGNLIDSVTISTNNFLRFDDLAFTTAIPEPTSALAGVIGLGLLAGRRR